MLTDTQKKAAETVYNDSLEIIEKTIGAFYMKYGGDWDEYRADADTLFIRAFAEYNGQAAWCTYLNNWIWFGLLDPLRTKAARAAKHAMLGGEALASVAQRTGFDLDAFAESLTEDAALVVQLVLCPPVEIEAAAEKKGGEPRNVRSVLRAYLQAAGWSAARVAESFAEIRSILG